MSIASLRARVKTLLIRPAWQRARYDQGTGGVLTVNPVHLAGGVVGGVIRS